LLYYIRLGLVLLLKTKLLEENVVNKQFSHVTRYKISVCLLHFSQQKPQNTFRTIVLSISTERVYVLSISTERVYVLFISKEGVYVLFISTEGVYVLSIITEKCVCF
jgi:hypothetical protein